MFIQSLSQILPSVRFGADFRFISHNRISNSAEARDISVNKVKAKKQLVGEPYTLQTAKTGSRDLFSPSAYVCTVVRIGNPNGRGRFFHLDPTIYIRNRADYGKSFVEEFGKQIDDFIEQTNQLKRQKRLPENEPMSGFVLGGQREGVESAQLKNLIEAVLKAKNIPYSKLWGMPKNHSMHIMNCPKTGPKGTTLLGICHNHFSELDFPIAPREPNTLPLKQSTMRRQHGFDFYLSQPRLKNLFSEISLLKGDKVFMGDERVNLDLSA